MINYDNKQFLLSKQKCELKYQKTVLVETTHNLFFVKT